MLTVNKLIPQGRGLAQVLLKRAPSVELDWDVRQKSRFDATDSAGRTLAVFLPRGTAVRGGDVLVAEDGSLVRVIAAPQAVLVVRHCTAHGTPFDLLRAAYHLGNRHVPLQLAPDHLKLEPDHVLADMLRQNHLIVTEAQEGFDPEGGAYGQGGHGHAHPHAGDHDHGHAPGHGVHAHDPAHDGHAHHDHGQGHVHGPDCDHGHDHAPAPVAVPISRIQRGGRASVPVAAATPHVHGPGCNHGHDHAHAHDHGHAHAPAATPAPAAGDTGSPAHGHAHGPGCGHDH
ncbi:MAG: urease accessory protein UreE [Pseudomonadota bacterium]